MRTTRSDGIGCRTMVAHIPNKQYNLAAPEGLTSRIIGYQRRRMYDRFLAATGVTSADSILDVGATGDQSYGWSNYLEEWYPHKASLTATGIDDAGFLEALHPGLRFVRANALGLPFADCAFDVVHSSAVLEHVGSLRNQITFVQECCRVARKATFFTTPNRWFPIEFHTGIPLVHWLPKAAFRALMRASGYAFFAEEANLNLLTGRELHAIALNIAGFAFELGHVSLAGLPSNLLLVGRNTRANPGE
jgi:ubiquinone/menaquinone biosynthesis C-methylase UbiE